MKKKNIGPIGIHPPYKPKSMKKRQADTTDAEPNPLTVDRASVVMEAICNKFAEVALNQAGKVVNEQRFVDELAKAVDEAMVQDQSTILQLSEQAKNIKPSNSGSCTAGNDVKLVEWTVKEVPENEIVTTIEIDGTTQEVGDENVIFCEDVTHCHVQEDAIQIDITFNYANPPTVETTTDDSTVQPGQLHRRDLPIEYNTLSSSASSSLQYSSFRDSSSMTLTLTLIVILYMYVFNSRR